MRDWARSSRSKPKIVMALSRPSSNLGEAAEPDGGLISTCREMIERRACGGN
jgi:hypothetical protein